VVVSGVVVNRFRLLFPDGITDLLPAGDDSSLL
jgi:hypothetical protein